MYSLTSTAKCKVIKCVEAATMWLCSALQRDAGVGMAWLLIVTWSNVAVSSAALLEENKH